MAAAGRVLPTVADQGHAWPVPSFPPAQKQHLDGQVLVHGFTAWMVHFNLSRFQQEGRDSASSVFVCPQIKPLPFANVPCRPLSVNSLTQF